MGLVGADIASADSLKAINWAKTRIQRMIDLYYDQKLGSFSTTAGKRAYAMSSVASDYHKVIEPPWILDGSSRVWLRWSNRTGEVQDYAPISTETQKRPEILYRVGTDFRVAPTPDKVYTIQFDYWAFKADLVNAGDSDDITNNADMLILEEAARILSEDRGWSKQAGEWKTSRNESLKELHDDMTEEELGATVIVSRGMHSSDYYDQRGYRRRNDYP